MLLMSLWRAAKAEIAANSELSLLLWVSLLKTVNCQERLRNFRRHRHTVGCMMTILSTLACLVCTENLIPVGDRQNHLPSERDDRPDVLLPSVIHLTPQVENST
jgi:hypothetical protein